MQGDYTATKAGGGLHVARNQERAGREPLSVRHSSGHAHWSNSAVMAEDLDSPKDDSAAVLTAKSQALKALHAVANTLLKQLSDLRLPGSN